MATVRRLTAILAADVAGYSRLMGVDEEGTHERLKTHLRDLVEPKITDHRGRTVKNTGDGFLAEFHSVVDAVRCAVEVQRGMVTRNASIPPEQRIELRVGINLGDVIAEGDDIFGDGVNVAARLEALAEPGGICVSRVVRDQVRDRLDYTFEDLGEQTVKNIARPVRVFALRPATSAAMPMPDAVPVREVPISARRRRSIAPLIATTVATMFVIAVIAWWVWLAPRTISTAPGVSAGTATTSIGAPLVAPRLSIVVLPFANLSNDPDQQYFADGITEDLTTDLSHIPDMIVIAGTTALTFKNKPVDAKQIGRELGVRYLLEGSVQRSGNQIRVNAQLIEAETAAHLWAERFDRKMDDLLVLQNEITNRIANALGVELINREATQLVERPDALDYILRGRAAFSKAPSRDNYEQAIRLFEHALALDPQSVEAKSWLAVVLSVRVLDGMTGSRSADVARANELVTQVLAASPRNPLIHVVRGTVLRAPNRCEEAITEYETALTTDSNLVTALHGLALCKLLTGSIDAVIPLEERAIRLSPRGSDIGWWYFLIGTVHLLQSRTDEAIAWFEKARSVLPAVPSFHSRLAAAYALDGDAERAAAELAEARRLGGQASYSSIAHLRTVGDWGVPKTRTLFEATYFTGLRKAGVPEE
jgi:TolB-like protein/class 3 adenylate cyclase/Tfp pilus assembly protein PilF